MKGKGVIRSLRIWLDVLTRLNTPFRATRPFTLGEVQALLALYDALMEEHELVSDLIQRFYSSPGMPQTIKIELEEANQKVEEMDNDPEDN